MQLDLQTAPETLENYLKHKGWISGGQRVEALEKPGEGNMNMVIRARGEGFSLIVKQSRPFVNKFPTIPAPAQRIHTENQFYKLCSQSKELSERMPSVVGFDPEQNIMVIEDLGDSSDYTRIYRPGEDLMQKEFDQAVLWLQRLHSTDFDERVKKVFPDNLELRRLNHEHIFHYPFEMDNGMDLDAVQHGLQNVSIQFKKDDLLKSAVRKLGERYLSEGNCLLHGDYYPGSWLKTEDGLKIIDPEFCFFGPAEFDIGVFSAHLKMAKSKFDLLAVYDTVDLDKDLILRFEAVEIMRRLIGLAQLPVHLDLQEKVGLLKEARTKL